MRVIEPVLYSRKEINILPLFEWPLKSGILKKKHLQCGRYSVLLFFPSEAFLRIIYLVSHCPVLNLLVVHLIH